MSGVLLVFACCDEFIYSYSYAMLYCAMNVYSDCFYGGVSLCCCHAYRGTLVLLSTVNMQCCIVLWLFTAVVATVVCQYVLPYTLWHTGITVGCCY